MFRIKKRFPLILILLAAGSCSQEKIDTETKQDLTAKAESDPYFTGVRFSVHNGVVILSGACPTEKAKLEIMEKTRKIAGVKKVEDQLMIAPVTIGLDDDLKKSVDSVLKNYPRVTAAVQDSTVTLSGIASFRRTEELLTAIRELRPRMLNNLILAEEEKP